MSAEDQRLVDPAGVRGRHHRVDHDLTALAAGCVVLTGAERIEPDLVDDRATEAACSIGSEA